VAHPQGADRHKANRFWWNLKGRSEFDLRRLGERSLAGRWQSGGSGAKEGSESGTDLWENAFGYLDKGAIQGTAGREFVAASAEMLGDGGNVDCAFGTKADADPAPRELAEEGCGLDTGNAKGVVDDAFAIFVGGAGVDYIVVRDG
jgi:hypothetical protein